MPGIMAEVTAQPWQPILDALSGQITVANVAAMLAAVVGVGIGFVLLWWGARKAVSAFMSAFQRGKFKF